MRIGIVGLPNVGKSTLFQALTKQQVDISNYPFCTIDPNIGVVAVPDERLEKIKELVKPEKVVPAVVEFVDIYCLVKGAHQGEGLGNQFLSHIYPVDAIAVVLRCFKDENIVHVEKTIDPNRDLEIIKNELAKKDEEILSRGNPVRNKISNGAGEKKDAQMLSKKPAIYICNIKSGAENIEPKECHLKIDFKLEL
jgi:GTP-binding protein YchF